MIYVLSGFTGREKCINLQLRRGQKRIGSELLFAVFQSSSNFRQKIRLVAHSQIDKCGHLAKV